MRIRRLNMSEDASDGIRLEYLFMLFYLSSRL